MLAGLQHRVVDIFVDGQAPSPHLPVELQDQQPLLAGAAGQHNGGKGPGVGPAFQLTPGKLLKELRQQMTASACEALTHVYTKPCTYPWSYWVAAKFCRTLQRSMGS